ncbi:MAG: CHASE2 domain-containing protein, partial [Hyphomicrobiales bacterium]|nr:CHASE2 domain-containing protein [Hyphomicrobiales bacterium]
MVALAIMPALAGAWLALRPPAGFARLRDLAFDEYQVARPRAWSPDIPVRVVDIDEASLKAYGQWPWPRLLLAKLTDRLAADGAAAVAFDVVFAEPDRNSPDRIVATLPPSAERDALAAKLAGQPGDDAQFAAAIARAPVALATKLVNVGGDAPPVKAGFATAGAPAAPFLPRLDGAVGPLPALAAAAKGVGAVNFFPDRDLVVRKIPLLISVGPPGGPVRYVPSLAAEALRIAQGASTVVVKTSDASGGTTSGAADGVIAVKIGALEIPTDRDGQVRVHFAGYRRARHVSLVDVMEGRIPEGALTGKIVFVGATALELLDLRSTPLQGAVPGVDLHAELAEQALSGAGLARPDWARDAEALAAFLGALAVGGLALTRRPVAAALGAATGVVGAA